MHILLQRYMDRVNQESRIKLREEPAKPKAAAYVISAVVGLGLLYATITTEPAPRHNDGLVKIVREK